MGRLKCHLREFRFCLDANEKLAEDSQQVRERGLWMRWWGAMGCLVLFFFPVPCITFIALYNYYI